ncbi:MAG: PDZ domain-containing protein [Gammaproteobacteria bacterium]|nr:PDZ domain-containing protein [Gammaproteobacteria bacterium]
MLNSISIRLVEPARWLVVALIAYTLATGILYFVSPPQRDPTSQDLPAATDSRRASPNINDILSRNLFGVADATNKPRQSTAAARETRLPLELQGVFVAEISADSAAIVAQKGKKGTLYAIGQTLPGNAELVEVHTDHIVLRRAGVRETLTFPEVTAQMIANSEPYDTALARPTLPQQGSRNRDFSRETQPPSDTRGSDRRAAAGDIVSTYRKLIDDDPEAALSGLGIAPVRQGASSGYRLGSLADSPYLSQTGLQPGDVILSVNGRPVGDISRDKMEIDNVLAQGSARLEVQRGTRRFFVTASLR